MMIVEKVLPDNAERQLFADIPRQFGIQMRASGHFPRGQAPDEIE